jgi:alanine racemase
MMEVFPITDFPRSRAIVEIDTDALTHNYTLLSALCRGRTAPRVIAVVKADAYGLGLSLVAPALCRAGCDCFAVATPDEAISLRKLIPCADILILGYTPPQRAEELSCHRLTQTVFSPEYAKALCLAACRRGVSVKIHLKIDGGMCRLGFSPSDTASLLTALRSPGLTATGIYTHFPVADTDKTRTKEALNAFLACRGALLSRGAPLFAHAAASAALLQGIGTNLDGVRPGLSLYGISPVKTALPLRRALRLSAPIVQVNGVSKGTPVGYGGTFVTTRPSRIGTLPLGYADGIPRSFGGLVLRGMHGGTAFFIPVVGLVCMDQMMVDLTDTPLTVGDRVYFYDDIETDARALGTIPYELLTRLGSRIPRIKQRRPKP